MTDEEALAALAGEMIPGRCTDEDFFVCRDSLMGIAARQERAFAETVRIWQQRDMRLIKPLLPRVMDERQLQCLAGALQDQGIWEITSMTDRRLIAAMVNNASRAAASVPERFWQAVLHGVCVEEDPSLELLEQCMNAIGWRKCLEYSLGNDGADSAARLVSNMLTICRGRGEEVPELEARGATPQAYWALSQLLVQGLSPSEWTQIFWNLLNRRVPGCQSHATEIRERGLGALSKTSDPSLGEALTRLVLLHGGLGEILALRALQQQASH